MEVYTLSVTPLIHFLSEIIFISEDRSKEEAFPDDLQLLENQATSKHIGIYCNNKGLCLTTSLNHPNHI